MWRTIFYTTPRTANWIRCYFLLRDYPGLALHERLALLKAILHHIRYAAANEVPDMPNMVVHLFERLIHFGLQWPEFAESASWVRKGVEGLDLLLDDYFYPDGAYIELCYFVHPVFVEVARLGQQGIVELPEDFAKKVGRIFDFPAYMVKPNGAYPSVNDVYSAQDPDAVPERREGLVSLGLEFTERDDLRHIHTFGHEGSPPPRTSCSFPYAGFYVMRSDWSAEARYLVFDGGKSAGGHNHVDKLSCELYAYGNTLVTDSGCAGPWASARRSEYFVGTAGHNTIMVDGRGQVAGVPLFAIPSLKGRTPWHQIAPEPLPNAWTSGEHFDYARSRYDGGYATYGSEQSRLRGFRYELNRVEEVSRMQPWTQTQGGELREMPRERLSAIHERTVLFVKPDYWILSDRVLGKGKHRIESLFHFQASAAAQIEAPDRSVRTVNGRAGMTILPVSEANLEVRIARGETGPLQGWVPANWGEHRPAPAAVYSAETELPVGIDTVLYPYPKDEEPELHVEPLEASEDGEMCPPWEASGLRVRVDGREDYYAAAHERTALRGYGPVRFDGRAAVVRRTEDGEIWRVSVVDGSYVEVDGAPILEAEHTCESLELTCEGETLSIRCHPEVGVTVRVGNARRLVANGREARAVSPSEERVRIFADWLD